MSSFDANPWNTPELQKFVSGTFLAAFESWPKSYEDIERAMGVPFEKQTDKLFTVPEWHGDISTSGPVETMLLLCEVFRFREAIKRSGAQRGYIEHKSSPLGPDFIQFFIDAQPNTLSAVERLMNTIRGNRSGAPIYRKHKTIPADLNWLDRALYHLDIQGGDFDRTRQREVNITPGIVSAFEESLGPEYCAIINQQDLSASTAPVQYATPKRRSL